MSRVDCSMSHLCAILNGVAGVVVFSVPSAVSSAWFPPAERTTATAVGILFNNLGNALRDYSYMTSLMSSTCS